MSVLNSLNQTLTGLSRIGGGTSSTDVDLMDLILAAKNSAYTPDSDGGTLGEILAGFETLTGNYTFDPHSPLEFGEPIVRMTRDVTSTGEVTDGDVVDDISDYQTELDNLEGQIDNPDEAEDNFLHEVITLGNGEAINHNIELITGKKLEEIEQLLQEIALDRVQEKVVDGIKEFDPNTSGGIGGSTALSSLLSTAISKVSSFIPSISGGVLDDFLIDQDDTINSTIQDIMGTNNVSDGFKQNILSLVSGGSIDEAASLMEGSSSYDLSTIITMLSGLDLDPKAILNGALPSSIKSITGDLGSFAGSSTSSSYEFESIETAEEFEAELAASTREVNTIVIHSTGSETTNATEIQTAHTAAGFDGAQYHYIIHQDGKVEAGRPISSPGSSGDGALDIALVGNSNIALDREGTTAQDRSFEHLINASFNVVPGMEIITAEGLGAQTDNTPDTDRIAPTENNNSVPPQQYSNVGRCSYGRGRSGSYIPGEDTPGTVPHDPRYDEPGLTNIQPDLKRILEYCVANTPGVSGAKTTTGRSTHGSGRHLQGYASDTALLNSEGRRLSTEIPADIEHIAQFTDIFFQYAAQNGHRGSVGWGYPGAGGSTYMSNNAGHYDISAGKHLNNSGATIIATVWGNNGDGKYTPPWLRQVARKNGYNV